MKLKRAAAFLMRNEYDFMNNEKILKHYETCIISVAEYHNRKTRLTIQVVYAIKNNGETEVRSFNAVGVKGKKLNCISVLNFPRLLSNGELNFLGL